MDEFRNLPKPSLSTGPLPAPGAPSPAPKPPAPVPPPSAPSKAMTGDLGAFQRTQESRQAAETMLADSLPWETPEAPAPELPKAPPALPKPAAARPGLTGQLPAMPRIPDRPQRDTRALSSAALPDVGRGRLTGNLSATGAMQAGHQDLAAALQKQVARPDLVAQVPGKSTCVAATVQKTLARQNPELYARIMSELVGLGAARLPNGAMLAVSKANLNWIEAQRFSPEGKLDALMQAALMELGAPGEGYLLSIDGFAAFPAKAAGLSLDQARKLIETLLKAPVLDPRDLKGKWDRHFLAAGETPPSDPLTATPSAALVRELLEGAEPGTFAAVRARDAKGALLRDEFGRPFVEDETNEDEAEREKRPPKKTHMVQIIATDEAAGTVTYIDALGTQRTVAAASFARILLMTTRSSELEGIGSPFGAAIG